MKRNTWSNSVAFLLLSLALLGFAAVASAADDNLLRNPSFEEIDPATGIPVGWLRFSGEVGQTLFFTDEEAFEGKFSMKGIQESTSTNGIRSQRFAVQPGETYELSVWVKTVDLPGAGVESKAWIGIETWPNETTVNSADRQWKNSNVSAPQWTQLTVTFTVPDGQYYANVILYTLSTNRGIAYWNAPKLVKIN